MIQLEKFINLLRNNDSLSDYDELQIRENWEDALAAAATALERMPSIGFLSTKKRINTFLAVCSHLDQLVSNSFINREQAQMALQVLRLSNKSFEKAITMFELRQSRFGIRAIAELPESARLYLMSMR
ncbi:MAG: hypothetical protein JKY55_12585 [Aliivibrio sp.]|uniref:hypothetical protein n=1 Tax=Aliivibrio sp. TaxID=1872443 RepID=UPI001A44501E|nr:hypothetical protein [Aliivibrio sp.]